VSTNVPPPVPASKVASNTSDWERHTHQDKELVKGLGLTSATMLVMGSMIGSGIFIVSAEISREVNSPALLIGAWLITGFLTIIGALTYGELAAMMPRAGGQYVYLRESLGPLWGFLYGWTLFLVIQTGTIAAVGVAFGKFLGIFFPSISSSHWLPGFWQAPEWHIGPMVLGNMKVGLNTQNLVAIAVVVILSVINIFGVKTGALIQNIFTSAKVAALLGLVIFGILLGRNAQALAANFGANFWKGAGLGRSSGLDPDRAGNCPGRIAVFRGCLEQRYVYRRRSEKSQPQSSAVAGARHGRGDRTLYRVQLYLSERPAAGGQSGWFNAG
jgi:amino acid transporter